MSKNLSVFFDTEFTSLSGDCRFLISIALVAADGRECYRELSNWQPHHCSPWVLENVLPLLDGELVPEEQVAKDLQAFIESLSSDLDTEVILRSDCPRLDWYFVEDLFNFFGCWPKNMRRKCGVISFDNDNLEHRFEAGLKSFWKDNEAKRHHALYDARSLRFAWKYALRRGI